MKGDKRTTCPSGCLCGALSCWGQQVGFLPSRDDAFYNEEVKKIIMEINSRTAVAHELCQAELWMWRAVLQCRQSRKPHLTHGLGGELTWLHATPRGLMEQACVRVWRWASVVAWLHACEPSCHLMHTDVLLANYLIGLNRVNQTKWHQLALQG